MARVSARSLLALPPDEVWRLMTDEALRPEWDASVVRFARDGEQGAADARLWYTAPLVAALTWRWEGRYASFDPPTRSSVRMKRGSALRPFRHLAGTWILLPEGEGTRVELIAQFEPRVRPLGALMERRVRKLLDRSLKRLSQLATGRG